jgi:uncharacterized protein (TIGR03032 family)
LSETVTKTIQCKIDPGFGRWIASAGGSVVITTYQAGKVALVGWTGTAVHITMRDFDQPMGVAIDGDRLALATAHDLILFSNARLLAREYLEKGRYDALYIPRMSYHTADLNLHDLAFGNVPGELWAVNTRFGCLATLSDHFSFVPRWQPPFLSLLAPEDRCHLNGLAMVEGQPRYVTALGKTDTPRGWVPGKATGGILMEVPTNRVILEGLCMPHSPRWRDGRLWVLNSGLGELWTVDPTNGGHKVIAQLPGYLRGLDFVGPYAVIGMSKVRARHIFAGLPVQQRCKELTCGVAIVDTRNGSCEGTLEFTSAAEELYDVGFLPGVFTPTILNHRQEASRQAITAPEFAYWIRPEPGEVPPGAPGRPASDRPS